MYFFLFIVFFFCSKGARTKDKISIYVLPVLMYDFFSSVYFYIYTSYMLYDERNARAFFSSCSAISSYFVSTFFFLLFYARVCINFKANIYLERFNETSFFLFND